jgi:hypothetical protein
MEHSSGLRKIARLDCVGGGPVTWMGNSPTSAIWTRAWAPALPTRVLRAKADPSKFPAEEAAIVTYVRQLMRTNRAEQVAFDALHGKHGTKWLVELTTGVHYYAMLCGVVNAFEVAAPPDGDKLPA